MAFESRTQEEILKELQDWSETAAAKFEGTFEYDVFSSNAIEFQKIELELEEVYQASFGHLSWGDYLTMRAAESGVIRRPAKKSIGTLEVTGTGTIYEGSIFSTEAGTRFVATSTTNIVGSGIIDIEAAVAGSSGNVAANTITKIPLSIAGISTCNNPAATLDGYDEEDDETLRDRYLTKVRYPATSGNPREYVEWAMSIVGVGAARCIRCYNGPGTVKVIIVDSNFEEANAVLIQRVADYINEERPVGIVEGGVNVVSAKPVLVNISAQIIGEIDVDSFTDGVKNYFRKLTNKILTPENKNNLEVSIHKLESYIVAEGGADDFRNCTINGARKNIPLTYEDLPTLGEVNFS